MTDLRQLPAIRALAEERAREYVRVGSGWSRDQCWDRMLSTPERKAQIDANLDLLTDLSRPDSRDAVARLVASKMNREGWQVTQAIEDGGVELLVLCEDAHVDWSAMETASVADVLTMIALAVLA